MSGTQLMSQPASGPAWSNLLNRANQPCGTPDLRDQEDTTNVCVLAKALVFARTGQASYRNGVVAAIRSIANSGTYVGRALSLAREIGTYAIAADLINLKAHDPALDSLFRAKLITLRSTYTSGGPSDLVDCHEDRPNNWGTHCGASRAAIAAYLGDTADLQRTAQVFKGYLGDRASYAGFRYGETSWQCNESAPVGINPAGCAKNGRPIGGVLPDDQRRGGSFQWPAPNENYVWEGLQGALMQAVILNRAGYDVFNWGNRALLRAVEWQYTHNGYPAAGDDTWIPHLINYFYGTQFPVRTPASPGKNMGWTDWTHAAARATGAVLGVNPSTLSFTATAGTSPAPQVVQIGNAAGGAMSWSATKNMSWIHLSAYSGTGPASLTVTVNASALPPGTHTGAIVVSSAGAQGSPHTIPVTVSVAAAPSAQAVVTALAVSPVLVVGGVVAVGTVTISAPAPAGGVSVALADDSSSVYVPAAITIPAGATSIAFPISTTTVAARQQATITATLNGAVQAVLVVTPPAAVRPLLPRLGGDVLR